MTKRNYGDPEEKERIDKFKKDEEEESFLAALNDCLIPFEKQLLSRVKSLRFPVSFVVGLPRCGSTLFMQLAVSTYELGYPSNLMARFFKVPAVGAWLHRLVMGKTSLNRTSYQSTYGVTALPEEPHEFGYFWTSFFTPGATHWFEEDSLDKVDHKELLRKLGAIETILNKPLIFKSLNLDFLIQYLGRVLEQPLFIYVRRDLYFVAQSIYLARIKRYGTAEAWWSLRPKQYDFLKKLDPYCQVAGQVWAIKAELERQLSTIRGDHKLELDYRGICENPVLELNRFAEKMAALNVPLRKYSEPPARLICEDKNKLCKKDAWNLRQALEKMKNFTAW